jgi:hypothetical protein
MSFETPHGKEGHKNPLLRPVSSLNQGDLVLENGVATEIKAKRRSATGITLELASGGFMNVDDEHEEVEVPPSS